MQRCTDTFQRCTSDVFPSTVAAADGEQRQDEPDGHPTSGEPIAHRCDGGFDNLRRASLFSRTRTTTVQQ